MPSGLVLRPASLQDAALVVEMSNEDAAETGSAEVATVETTLHEWRTPGFDVARCIRIAELDGEVAGHCWVWPEKEVLHGGGYTRAHLRGRGVGTAMMDWMFATAREIRRGRFYSGASSARPEAEVMLKERGMTYERTFLRMVHRAPAMAPEPRWPAGIEPRALQGDELLDAFIAAHDGSFIDHWEFTPADRTDWAHRLSEEDPSLWFVAFSGEQVAGMNRLRLSGDGRAGLLGPIGTTRAFRGIGLGRALLRHGMRTVAAKGAEQVQLGVDSINPTGAVRLYESEGFERTTEFRLYVSSL